MIKIENNWFVKLNFNKNKLKLILSIFALILVKFGLSFGLISFVSTNNDQPNIISNDLAYRMVITENIESSNLFNDNIIKINKENEKKEFLLNIYSLNDIDTKYGITYKVCGKFDINKSKCTEYIDKPEDLKIYYSEETDYPVEGNISSNGLALVSVIIDSSNSEYYTTIVGTDDKNIIEENLGIYVEFNLKACRLDSDLAYINPFDLSSGLLGGFENNDLSTIAYVDGVIISGMPTSGYYTASVNCHKKGETTATTAIGAAIWDCSKWNLNVSNITESTVCEVNFTTSSVASTPFPVFSYIVGGTDVGNASSSDITKTTDESKVKLEISSDNKWMIYFYVSGTFTIQNGSYITDIWVVGGGGGGGTMHSHSHNDATGWYTCYSGGGGGGGGHTKLLTNVIISNTAKLVTIGDGGAPGVAGSASSIAGVDGASANGGTAGGNGVNYAGGSGGTGSATGGSGGHYIAWTNGTAAGTAGGDGVYDFNDSSLTMRCGAGGGGGGYGQGHGNYQGSGNGGLGGGGKGGYNNVSPISGFANYGAGGGGGFNTNNGLGAAGGSGIVIIRGTTAGGSC